MSKTTITTFFCLALAAQAVFSAPPPAAAAPSCTSQNCVRPDCVCASINAPPTITKIPQFVFLTFDDAITAQNYERYSTAFFNKTNPDGCPLAATYFASHEYTDYTLVHDLYQRGHEIALHSISHSPYTDYWKQISREDLLAEFADERKTIAYFANIPESALQGMRLPFLQLSGDTSFEVAKEIGLSYDSSWPTQVYRDPGLWPYTLDYATFQDCPIGECPKSSIEGVWEFPMIDWVDEGNIVCSMMDACVNIPEDREGLVAWFKDNFLVQYQGTRSPWGFFMHAAWFLQEEHPHRFEAYLEFIDYLQSLEDVFIVGMSTVRKWMQNPVEFGSEDWPKCEVREDLGCRAVTCPNLKKENEVRRMDVCVACPLVYPWLRNPYGNLTTI